MTNLAENLERQENCTPKEWDEMVNLLTRVHTAQWNSSTVQDEFASRLIRIAKDVHDANEKKRATQQSSHS
jgi:non-homologous end joining protein Ku